MRANHGDRRGLHVNTFTVEGVELGNRTELDGRILRVSIADIVALCTLDFAAKLNELPHSPQEKNLDRWYQSVSGRPSASAYDQPESMADSIRSFVRDNFGSG